MTEEVTAIREALAELDAKNDDHWTENGLPRLDALGIAGLKRADVTSAAPLFNRTNAVLEAKPEPEPEPEPVALAVPEQPTHDEMDELEEQVRDAEAEVQRCETAKQMAERAVRVAQVKRDTLSIRLEKARPKHENMLGIMAVLAQDQKTREERAGVAQELRAAGITQQLLQPGSKLDQAMARKRGFGLNRPQLTQKAAGA